MGALELKPCPFCGSSAEIVHIDEGENAGGSCVSCTRCLASGNVEFGFKENYVSNWNRRADLPTGYVILSPDEVRGIRDEALEEAANEAKSWEKTARKLSRKEPDEDRSLYHSLAGDMARDVAAAIRSLKGGRDAQ